MAATSSFREEHREMIRRIELGRRMIACTSRHVVGVKGDGTVLALGDNSNGQCDVSHWRDIVQVAVAFSATAGLRSDGTVVCTKPYIQEKVKDLRDVVYIALEIDFLVCVKRDGSVVVISTSYYNTQAFCDTERIAVSVGHFLGILKNGRVAAAGHSSDGELNVEGWRDIADVATICFATLGLKSDGTVIAAGCEKEGGSHAILRQTALWKNILAVFGYWIPTGLRPDGTAVVADHNHDPENPCEEDGETVDKKAVVESWTDLIAVADDSDLMVGLHSDGTVSVCYTGSGHPEVLEAENWKLFDDIDDVEEERRVRRMMAEAARQDALMKLQEQVLTLMEERNKLGLFSGKRKKELDARIAELNSKIDLMQN